VVLSAECKEGAGKGEWMVRNELLKKTLHKMKLQFHL
jgi:hypothetical protein